MTPGGVRSVVRTVSVLRVTMDGDGVMPEADRKKLGEIVTKAHAQGRRVRFWGAPDNETFWRAMRAADVDLINTDDLSGVEKFLRAEAN